MPLTTSRMVTIAMLIVVGIVSVATLRRDGVITAQAASAAQDGAWIRPNPGETALVWGRRDGLVFGIPSAGGLPGPRGLVRVGTRGSRMAFSELEMSELDRGERGKRLWVEEARGDLAILPAKAAPIERLSVPIEVEPFTANGTRVRVTASISSDRPRELALAVRQLDGSAPIEELTLTATMGNYERLRQLWLRERTVDSRALYEHYADSGFVDKENYPRHEMLTIGDGDAIVLATTNEDDPASVAVAAKPWWTYRSIKLTQYWRVPARHIQPDLRVKVNGRRVYWQSTDPIPGGPAFENVEVRQRYVRDQVFVFGLTPTSPQAFVPTIPGLAVPAAVPR
jgi:hypothetical protein